jgi:hypothetical protein
MIRGLGALPDPHWACGTHCPEELCGVAPFPLDVDWSPLCAPVLDQGASQSCTGHAWANALCQVMRAKDANAERPSALLLYDMGRGLVGRRGLDEGLPIGAVGEAAITCGFAPESVVPWDESRVLEHLYTDEYQGAITQAGLKTHLALINKRSSIVAAVASKLGVVIGIDADQSLMDFGGGAVWEGMRGPVLGGHALSVCGYSDRGALVQNSWGLGWGGAGFGTIGWDYLESIHCRSVWIVDAAPMYWRS